MLRKLVASIFLFLLSFFSGGEVKLLPQGVEIWREGKIESRIIMGISGREWVENLERIARKVGGRGREIKSEGWVYLAPLIYLRRYSVYGRGRKLLSFHLDFLTGKVVDGILQPSEKDGGVRIEGKIKERVRIEGVPGLPFYMSEKATVMAMLSLYWARKLRVSFPWKEKELVRELEGDCGLCGERVSLQILWALLGYRAEVKVWKEWKEKFIKEEIGKGRPVMMILSSRGISRYFLLTGWGKEKKRGYLEGKIPDFWKRGEGKVRIFLPFRTGKIRILTLYPEVQKGEFTRKAIP